jgi:hypothetical protein
MRKQLWIVLAAGLAVAISVLSFAGSTGKLQLQTGDEIYACDCGEGCPCQSMSRSAGNCTCGKAMVKATVAQVQANKVDLKAGSWEKARSFITVGKYACDCPPECKCDTISQNPGNCTCGKAMKKVEM